MPYADQSRYYCPERAPSIYESLIKLPGMTPKYAQVLAKQWTSHKSTSLHHQSYDVSNVGHACQYVAHTQGISWETMSATKFVRASTTFIKVYLKEVATSEPDSLLTRAQARTLSGQFRYFREEIDRRYYEENNRDLDTSTRYQRSHIRTIHR